ncbi:MAG: septum site-determining protein MinC [Candidatus Tectomicrobia bacterium]
MPLVKFSGTDYGLLMRLEWEAPFPQLLVELEEHLQQSRAFFTGARVFLEIGQDPLLQQDMEQLAVVLERYDVTLQGVVSAPPGQDRRPPVLPALLDPHTTLHLEGRTLRSGEKIAAEGHIIVLGDVNPGAEVIAGSNIFVWGSLKGSAYAGVPDRTEAVIAALYLAPIQLRIAGYIARPPEARAPAATVPELARVDRSGIVVEAWERGRILQKRG